MMSVHTLTREEIQAWMKIDGATYLELLRQSQDKFLAAIRPGDDEHTRRQAWERLPKLSKQLQMFCMLRYDLWEDPQP